MMYDFTIHTIIETNKECIFWGPWLYISTHYKMRMNEGGKSLILGYAETGEFLWSSSDHEGLLSIYDLHYGECTSYDC